jgi:hypothetical protein
MFRNTNIVYHLLGVVLVLFIPSVIFPNLIHSHSIPIAFIIKDTTLVALLICFFYAHYHYIIPKIYNSKKYILYLIIIILIFSFLCSFAIPFKHLLPDPHSHSKIGLTNLQYFLRELRQNFFFFIGVLFASLALKLNHQWKQIEQEKLNAELSYLKAQINPHFLFNTLNSIYSLALIKSDSTPKAILELSSLMRYVISESKEKFVPLEKEIDYIKSYIDLQKLRLDDTVCVSFTTEGEIQNKDISPLMLIPFIENAFKHGVNPEENSIIDIFLIVQGKNLLLKVTNALVTSITDIHTKSGFGIENAKTQLSLLYPNKHSLTLEEANHCFIVTLKLNIS